MVIYMQTHQLGDEDWKLLIQSSCVSYCRSVCLSVRQSQYEVQFLSVWFQTKTYLRRSKHKNGSKERYLSGQKHNPQIFGVIPFVKLQNDA